MNKTFQPLNFTKKVLQVMIISLMLLQIACNTRFSENVTRRGTILAIQPTWFMIMERDIIIFERVVTNLLLIPHPLTGLGTPPLISGLGTNNELL